MPLISKAFSDLITFTRASSATYFAANGVLTSAANNEPRFDYNPATYIGRGILIEESRTNSIRNNTMVGAVAGTPGTLPTNWQVFTLGGAATAVIGTGTENGISYVDVQFTGAASSSVSFFIDGTLNHAATNGQTWTNAAYYKLVAGSFTNVTANHVLYEADSAGNALAATTASLSAITGAALSNQRLVATRTNNNASTANVQAAITAVSTGASSFTLRIGLPQLEQGAFATSVIPTTTTALTRSADVASVNTLSPWFNSTAGTLFAEFNVPFALTSGTNPRLFAFVGAGGPAVDDLFLSLNQASGKNASFNIIAGGVNPGRIDASASFVAGATVKATGAYAANDRAVTSNGSAPTTSATAYTIPTVTAARIGSQDVFGNNALNGYLRRITYYPRRLSNADLQTITL